MPLKAKNEAWYEDKIQMRGEIYLWRGSSECAVERIVPPWHEMRETKRLAGMHIAKTQAGKHAVALCVRLSLLVIVKTRFYSGRSDGSVKTCEWQKCARPPFTQAA